ncbi:unnamed protein product [Phaedon cochleariae]|uniref:RanBP2-type domain-containing protein n=1 Tax=Phaedon cochleariae TaxID=80249 RepID=A0A9N9SFJ5_PHACE|nr:unnamed protein product [Phaedon cochleariae]
MVIMEDYRLAQNTFHELWQEIERSHLIYLEMDETPEKIEQRVKLEDYINDFLCVAADYQKYSNPETQEVLQRSASCKKDFSGYKAAAGFNAIQLYASNLLSQPWRKEYRQIKIYCGFYKHQVEANLVGAEKLFGAMGYRLYGNGLMVLEGPICPDRVTAVSKDCLIAYVECQIWKAIWEVLAPSFKISWLDVLEFRKTHICSPEQSIKALTYNNHQLQYQDHTRTYSEGSELFRVPRNHLANLSPVSPMNNSFPPLSSHLHIGLPQGQVHEPQFVNGCCTTAMPYANYIQGCNYATYGPAPVKPNYNTNGFYNGYGVPQVPTAKLIEIGHNGPSSDVVDHRSEHKSRHSEFLHNDLYKTRNGNQAKYHAEETPEKSDSQFEDWEYVYKNLESQGYTKDLGERGDVLSPDSLRQLREIKKSKGTNIDEALNHLNIDDRIRVNDVDKRVESEKKKEAATKIDKQISPSSSYDNVAHSKKQLQKTNLVMNYVKAKTLPKEKISVENKSQCTTPSTSKLKDDKSNKKKSGKVSDDREANTKWQCKACTLLNQQGKDICEMCGKSRIIAVEQPMEVGGAECTKCTLVNPKNAKDCLACDTSLVGYSFSWEQEHEKIK